MNQKALSSTGDVLLCHYFPSSSSAFQTPVKKEMMGFAKALPPLKKLRNSCFASQIKQTSSSGDERSDNEAVFPPRRLDVSPPWAASAATAPRGESSGKPSPKPASSYQPRVSTVSFYSKEKRYLTPLERKELSEKRSLGERDENLPAASRTGEMDLNWGRSISSRPAKRMPKRSKTVPKTLKKSKGETVAGKRSVGKENMSCLVKKKMDSPFRVLSMTVRPALKLPAGAAFFSSGRRSHGKKPAVEMEPLQGLPKPQKIDGPGAPTAAEPRSAERSDAAEAGGGSKGSSVPQAKGNGATEDFTGHAEQEGKSAQTSPQGSGSSSDPSSPSQRAATGDGDAENVVGRGVVTRTGCWEGTRAPQCAVK